MHVLTERGCPDLDSLKPDRGFFLIDLDSMSSQQLQHLLEEIQSHIDSFKETLADIESHYQTSLKLATDPASISSLMEQHSIHIGRQRTAIAKMEESYSQVRDHLASLGESNL